MSILPKKAQWCTMHISPLSDSTEIEGSISFVPSPLAQSTIEFTGSFCEYNKYIASTEGVEITDMQLAPMFGGEKTSITFNIINNTPKNCEFRLIRKKGSESAGEDQNAFLITPQEFGRNDEEQVLNFNPTEGFLEPYSRR